MPFPVADEYVECVGYAASALVLATFCFSNPVRLRIFALLSNVAFIAFGYFGSIYPVMLLHMILLPINGMHLLNLLSPKLIVHATPIMGRAHPHDM
jgi:CRP/FNR family cyclic AMP-dependent transcriptional regulator